MQDSSRDKFKAISTATLTTALFKRGFRNTFIAGIHRINPGAPRMVGPAYTMRYIPAREDLDQLSVFTDPDHPQRKSIEMIPPGHVMVVDCRRDTQAASGGEILTTRLMKVGAAGLVSDGPVRDGEPISELPFHVFCAGRSAPTNLIRHHAIDINVPIGCGGVAVYPADIIVGDNDGVVVIPQHLADEVARDATEQELLETFLLERVRSGARLPGTYPPNAETQAAYQAWRAEYVRNSRGNE